MLDHQETIICYFKFHPTVNHLINQQGLIRVEFNLKFDLTIGNLKIQFNHQENQIVHFKLVYSHPLISMILIIVLFHLQQP